MNTANALLADIRTCTVCADLPLGPRPIVQLGAQAKILLVGQAPGRITHHKGVPFDDPSGDRLRAWLGVDRATFYNPDVFAIVPMGFCFPGTGKGGDLPPRPECAVRWRRQIFETFGPFDLSLLIGRYAIDWHAPEHRRATVTQAAKDWQTTWPQRLILPHPSPRNTLWLKKNPWFEGEVVPKLQQLIQSLM